MTTTIPKRSKKPKKSKATSFTVRCREAQKTTYEEAARRLGYEDFSPFVLDVLDTVATSIEHSGWECRLVSVKDGRVLLVEGVESGIDPVGSYRLVAPESFWKSIAR
jgi:hypothetical protein